MTEAIGSFPFGAPLLPRPPSRREPSELMVIGAYPSALHVRWDPPPSSGLNRIQALAVDNEPNVFWTGDGEQDLIAEWASARFKPEWGTIAPAGRFNGSSGRWVTESVLPAFDVDPSGVWFTDCLDTYRTSTRQAVRIADTYAPFAAAEGLPQAVLPEHPTEGRIIAEATADHVERLREELTECSPTVVVTLGRAAANVFTAVAEVEGEEENPLSQDNYGQTLLIEWRGRAIQWVPLIHPGAPAQWKAIHAHWFDDQKIITAEVVDDDDDRGDPPRRMLARRLLAAGANTPRILAQEAVEALAEPAEERAEEARRREPEASVKQLVDRTIERARQLARAEGAVAGLSLTASEVTSVFGTAGTLTIPAVVLNLAGDLTALAWIQTRMVLEIAALHGRDVRGGDMVQDVLQLWAPHEASAPLSRPISKGLQRVSRRLLERYLRGPVLVSLKGLFRAVGINFSRAGLIRALPGVNIIANVGLNDRSTKLLGQRAHAYFN